MTCTPLINKPVFGSSGDAMYSHLLWNAFACQKVKHTTLYIFEREARLPAHLQSYQSSRFVPARKTDCTCGMQSGMQIGREGVLSFRRPTLDGLTGALREVIAAVKPGAKKLDLSILGDKTITE